MHTRIVLIGVILLTYFVVTVRAQSSKYDIPKREKTVKVMVLGVFHFNNPNADYAKFAGIDVLTPQRQKEIESVVDQLARFEPTKIALERPVREADSLRARYQRYRRGNYTLTRNEIHQLGFRLAHKMSHSELFPIDYLLGMRMDSLMMYARVHNETFFTEFNALVQKVVAVFDKMQSEETIGFNLRFMNEPGNVLRVHEPYAEMTTVGGDGNYVGASVVSDWYERNLHIFANIARIAKPGDRVLVIIGQGHAPILRELIHAHPTMELVEPLEYLK